MEEQEVLGEAIPDQPDWMQCFAIAPEYDDTNIPDNLVPPMDPNIDWLHILKTPEELFHGACTYISEQREVKPNFNRVIENMDADILNREEKFAYNILSNHLLHGLEEPFVTIATGGARTGKSTVIKPCVLGQMTYI